MKKRADDDVLLLAEKKYKKIFDKIDAEHPDFSVKVKHLKTQLRLQS